MGGGCKGDMGGLVDLEERPGVFRLFFDSGEPESLESSVFSAGLRLSSLTRGISDGVVDDTSSGIIEWTVGIRGGGGGTTIVGMGPL